MCNSNTFFYKTLLQKHWMCELHKNSWKLPVKENITIYKTYWQKQNIFYKKLYEVNL